jgi:death-on-curing protein
VDGNKRTGFVVGILFLELNSFNFRATEEDATQAVMALAAGTLNESGYTAWLRENTKRQPK